MKVSNIQRVAGHAADISLGRVGTILSGTENTMDGTLELYNGTGGALTAGKVVVLDSSGNIALTTTAQDPRPTGVVVDDIDAADYGSVTFFGPVDLVNVTASVTAGNYGETSTTSGSAQESTSAGAAFVYFTSSGTTPSGFLFGGRGGGIGSGTGGSETAFDHGNMGATETVDMGDGTWHRGTLNANCTITVSGFTVDEGLVCVLEITQDATGGWDITWDPDVEFIGNDQPTQTANSVTIFLLFSSAGDSTVYGAKVGGASAADISALGFVGPILISDSHSTPLVFADLLQTEAGDDLLYSDL